MADDASIARQRERDREYLDACEAARITPESPKYVAAHGTHELSDLDNLAPEGSATKNGHNIRNRDKDVEPLKELGPEAEGAARVIELHTPLRTGAKEFVQTAGRRALALAWILGKRPESLAELARQLGISRASLSTHVRRLEDRTRLHGRGQKGASTVATYRANAKRSWKLRRINKPMADAVASE